MQSELSGKHFSLGKNSPWAFLRVGEAISAHTALWIYLLAVVASGPLYMTGLI